MTVHLVKQGPHRCDLPTWATTGDVVECDECHRRWRFVNPGNPNYAGWRRVGRLKRWWQQRREM